MTVLKNHDISKRQPLWIRLVLGEYRFLLDCIILAAICTVAVGVRQFAVWDFEEVIHEFDPWFNYRATQKLVKDGYYAFDNWFDTRVWFPTGRYVGDTVYPGMMWTAAGLYHLQNSVLKVHVTIRFVCVHIPSIISACLCVLLYNLTTSIYNSTAGLLAALFYAVLPAATSRSVSGSFDNECTSIFAIMLAFWLWQKAVRTGSLLWTAASAFGYFYIVASWGAYIFVFNQIGLHTLALLILGKYSNKLYVSYSGFVSFGVLLSSLVKFIDDKSLSLQPHHIGPIGVFGIVQLIEISRFGKRIVMKETSNYIVHLVYRSIVFGTICLLVLISCGKIPTLTGRLVSLLGLNNAATIVKSVSEHQPTPWPYMFICFQSLLLFVPVSLLYCILYPNSDTIFILLYCQLCSYFSSSMIRLAVVLAPIICIHSGIAISIITTTFTNILINTKSSTTKVAVSNNEVAGKQGNTNSAGKHGGNSRINSQAQTSGSNTNLNVKNQKRGWFSRLQQPQSSTLYHRQVAMFIIAVQFGAIISLIRHSVSVTHTHYSHTSFIHTFVNIQNNFDYEDDSREAYAWQRWNTPYDAKVLSWWDYGYQISGMGDRTVYVDNNTNDYFQIATVGLVLSSTEKRAYQVVQMWDVDYILIFQSSMFNFGSDDVNKFLWMVRICNGYYPEVEERDYLNENGVYKVGNDASKRFRESLMYKMVYHNLPSQNGEIFDQTRRTPVTVSGIDFRYFEEAYTTSNYLVRIYRVKKETDKGFVEKLDMQRASLST